jgi:hypothetical protein
MMQVSLTEMLPPTGTFRNASDERLKQNIRDFEQRNGFLNSTASKNVSI